MAKSLTLSKREGSWLRRYLPWLVLAFASIPAMIWIGEAGLSPTGLYSGILLLVLCLILTLFNARKKLPFLPLFSAKIWLRFHICVGLLSLLLFGFHCGWRWPQSLFNQVLASVFLIVGMSGIIGWYLSVVLPKRLAQSGEPLTWERIPQLRVKLIQDVEALVRASTSTERPSVVFHDFYSQTLHEHLHRKAPITLALQDSDHRHLAVMSALAGLKRYMNQDEIQTAEELTRYLQAHRNLNFQHSGQSLLKLWLFLHIPFTYSLIILAIAHIGIVLSYRSHW